MLLSYPSIAPPEAVERILIVAPHMDDEAVGAGGYAVDAIAAGAEVFVVFLTAGDSARLSARLMHRTFDPTAAHFMAVGRTRIAEARQAMTILGVPPERFFVLGYPDRELRSLMEDPRRVVRSRATGCDRIPYDDALSPGADHTLENAVADLQRVFDRARPTTVIAPVPFDVHPDHSAAANLVDLALQRTGRNPQRLGYLVHTSRFRKPLLWQPGRALLPPPRLRSFQWVTYPVSAEGQRVKHEMLQAYRSQRPYTMLLRNAFIRMNELFFTYAPETGMNSQTSGLAGEGLAAFVTAAS